MGKRLSFLVILAGLLLSAQRLESQGFGFAARNAYQAFLRTIDSHFERFAALLPPSKITFLADGSDGGGDGTGSGSTGGTGDGGTDGGNGGTDGTGGDGGTDGGTGGTDGGESDSASNGAADAAAATSDAAAATSDDAATAAAAAAATTTTTDAAAVAATTTTTTDNADPDAPTTDPTTVAQAPTADPTDPPAVNQAVDPTDQNNAVTEELSSIEDIATTDPRGGSVPDEFAGPGIAGPGPGVAKVPGTPIAPVDVAI